MDMYTQLYSKWIPNKDSLNSTGNFTQCYVSAWMGGVLERERICVYVWPSPFTVHLKPPKHCYWAILQYKIKSLKSEKKKQVPSKHLPK